MGLPATYLAVDLAFVNTSQGSHAGVRLWYLPTSGTPTITLANIATYANDFKTAYATASGAALPDTVELTTVTLKWVSGGNEVEGQNTNGGITGDVGGDVLPEEDVICIQRRTGKQGRSKRGRVFWPYIPESFVEDGHLNTTGRAAALGLANMVKSVVTANGVSFTAKTLDHKNAVLETIVQAGYVTDTCSRRDRRSPKQLTAVRT